MAWRCAILTHDGSMVLLYMVCHGSHQYTPNVSIYQHHGSYGLYVLFQSIIQNVPVDQVWPLNDPFKRSQLTCVETSPALDPLVHETCKKRQQIYAPTQPLVKREELRNQIKRETSKLVNKWLHVKVM